MTTLPTLGSGIPVPLGQIDRELKHLWEQSGSIASRASLINLALYCTGRETMQRNTALIGEITLSHACRGILICTEPDAPENNVEAWISAHCHLGRAGAKQVCCEQLTFLLQGPSRQLIPSIVFSHLDSDLPLHLWWQGEFPNPIDRQLWHWVDRLIYDSRDWADRKEQFRLLNDSLADAKGRIILSDLNWTRSVYFRQGIAATFDNPVNLPQLALIGSVEISHNTGDRSTAKLVVGWLVSRLGWSVDHIDGNEFHFTSKQGRSIRATLTEQEGAPISRVAFKTEGGSYEFTREPGSDLLRSRVALDDGHTFDGLLPAGKDGPADLVDEELCRGGRNLVYLKAVTVAEELAS